MPSLTLEALPFRTALAAVLPFAATDAARPILTSVRLTISRGPKVELAACDNFRAGFATVSGEVIRSGPVPGEVILTRDDARALLKALPAKAPKRHTLPPLTLTWRAGAVTASLNGWSLAMRPVDGRYPNTAAIQPKGEVIALVTVDPKLMAEALLAMGSDVGVGSVAIEVRKPKVLGYHSSAASVAYLVRPNKGDQVKHALVMPVMVGV